MIENGTTVTLEHVEIMFRNFAGKEARFNKEGDRNFCIAIPDEIVDQMMDDGWNIKSLRPREDGDVPKRYLQLAVSYKIRPPRVILLGSKTRTPIPQEMVEIADFVDVAYVDVTFRARQWDDGGRPAIKAYLQTVYMKVIEDALDVKYADVPTVSLEEAMGIKSIGAGKDILELEAGTTYDLEGEVVG